MRHEIWILGIFFLLFFGCSDSEERLPSYRSNSDELDILRYEKKVYQNYQMREWNSALYEMKNIEVTEASGGQKAIVDLVENNLEFVFYYSTNCCMTCVDNYLGIIDKLFDDELSQSTSVITNYSTLRELKSKLYDLNLDLNAFLYQEKFPMPLSENSDHDSPLLFLLDQNLRVFMPRVGVSPDSISNPYFIRVKELLLHENFKE